MDPVTLRFEAVEPTKENLRLILLWRNDMVTRRMSFHREKKTWHTFVQEYHRRFQDKEGALPLFAIRGKEPIAFLGFEPTHPLLPGMEIQSEISINVAPSLRGQGWGTQILKGVIPHVAEKGVGEIYAEVREENLISRKLFANVGYEYLGMAWKTVADTGETCRIVRYSLSLNDGTVGHLHESRSA